MIQIIAHRGASRYAPENTMSAFLLAHKMGAQHMECDVVLCADKVPIVMHDHCLERTTNGNGKVDSVSFSYIQSLDAGSWFSDQFSGIKVLTLKELLIWQRKMKLYLHLEIKPLDLGSLNRDVDIIMDYVYQYGDSEKIKILTFQYDILQRLLLLDDKLPRTLGVRTCDKHSINLAVELGCFQINAHYRYLSKTHIAEVQRARMKCGAYTVNTAALLQRLRSFRIDEVYTDDLQIALPEI